MNQILTLTVNPALDESAEVENVAPEIKLRCDQPRREPGGGGINVARALRKLGGEALALYTCGGMTGEALGRLLAREGIPCQPVPVAEETRRSFTVFERGTSLQYRFNLPGPALSGEEWKACLERARQLAPRNGYLVASGSLPPGVPEDYYAQVVRAGQEAGARVVVDTSGAPLHAALAARPFLAKPNFRELCRLLGAEDEGALDVETAARDVVRQTGVEVLVVSLGAAGVLLATADRCVRIPSPTVPIQSKVGAGDSTVAGIVLGLVRGLPLDDAVRFGVAAGAAAVMTPGSELCRREDAERLYAGMGHWSVRKDE